MTNSADPDQLTSSEANRYGSTLFGKTGHVVFSMRRVNILEQTLKTTNKKIGFDVLFHKKKLKHIVFRFVLGFFHFLFFFFFFF